MMTLKLALFVGFAVCGVFAAPGEHRLDCELTEQSINEQECRKKECLWTPSTVGSHIPWCYLDTSKVGYHLKGSVIHQTSGLEAILEVNPEAHKSVPFAQVENLKLEVHYLSESILRVRITDPKNKRYEVPIQHELNIPNTNPKVTKYDVSLTEKFNLVVSRKGTGTKIIDTSIGGLIYGDNFIQFVTHVATEDVYGIGENYQTEFKHNFDYKTYPLFARDRPMGEKERNNYGVHPYYHVIENDGKAHGVLLLNSNAMAYTMLPTPAIAIKTLGGIIDLFVFVGDNPEQVTQLYTSVIGKPVMPPFWGLGFQLCRYGYKNLDQVKNVVKRNLEHNVPIDVKYLDIDYMDERRDFTYDPVNFIGLPEYIKETKEKNNFRWTLILDPAIEGDKPGYRAFDEGYKKDVFIKWPESVPASQRTKPGNAPTEKGVLYGHVWPNGPAAFPDFFKNATKQWWVEMHKEFHKTLPFDAIWIDMNEPSNFAASNILQCPKNSLANSVPSLNFKDSLEAATLCMIGVQGEHGEYRHYDVHSLFGWSETIPTSEAVHAATGKRGYVVTRSTYPTSGKYAAHWLGDNFSNWEQMRQSIIGMLQFSLFGISYTGADICGFIGNTSPELCRRWLQLGAYYPFSRSHNAMGSDDQDPGYYVEKGYPEVTKAAVDSLRTRYQLLHYLYTSFYHSHAHGSTLVRPFAHEFPHDPAARQIGDRFFLGSSILVNPFLYEHQTSVKAYIPKNTQWYKLSGDFVTKVAPTTEVEFTDKESSAPLLFKAESILPVVAEHALPKPLNSANLRKVPIELWVLPSSTAMAHGTLFYDDGESIDTVKSGHYNYYEFTLHQCQLTIKAPHRGFHTPAGSADILKVSAINIAVPNPKHQTFNVTIDGVQAKHSMANHKLTIETNLDLLKMTKDVTVNISDGTHTCFILH